MKPPPARSDSVVRAGGARGFRRPRCAACSLPLAGCLCKAFGPLSSRIGLCIVMPASESRSMSNTARLLALWLPGTRLIVRGLPSSEEAQQPSALRDVIVPEQAALLFPLDPDARRRGGHPDSRAFDEWPRATARAGHDPAARGRRRHLVAGTPHCST
jgi:DTW domain-containing protein YfiP